MSVETQRSVNTSLARGAMSLPELVFTALATLAPLTLVAAVMPLHFLVGGAAVPGGYIVAAAVMALFAVGLNTMLKYARSAGAFYLIIAKGLGKETGTASAMLAVLAYNALQVSTYGAIGVYAADSIARWTGVTLPWWFYGLVVLAIVGFFGIRGITASARVLATVLVLEILALVVLAIAVIASDKSGPVPVEALNPGLILRPESAAMFALIFGAFMGFESTAIYSEEVKGGARTVRRATYIVVAFIGLFYGFMALVVLTAYGFDGIDAAAADDPVGLVVQLFAVFTNPVVYEVMNILLILSAFAALLALHNASNRYVFTLGREGIIPRVFAHTGAKTSSPWVAGMLQSAVALAVLLFCIFGNVDPYTGLLLLGSAIGFLAIILLWALCSLSVLRYLRRTHPDEGLWRTTIAPALAFIGLVAATVAVIVNFDLYSGGDPVTNIVVFTLTILAAVGGIARALYLKRNKPEVYAVLATQSADDEEEPQPQVATS
ncbi:APC family permease [Ruicaihuangia caeni]|uniref:APC family permease n=1 Tax=Ruicaihuangia caeni TaxID=3042517 RepID=UPI00338EE1D8